jgi:hypothetical protein
MKQISLVIRDFYAIYVRDTDGDLWSFKLCSRGELQVFELDKDNEPVRMTKKQMVEIYKRIQELGDVFWSDALEDYDREEDKLTLVKLSLIVQRVGHCYSTLREEDFKKLGLV